MKKKILLSLVVGGLLGLSFMGCEGDGKYQISNSEQKTTYLLNKESGEVFFIDNKTMYKVATETNTTNKIGEILKLNSEVDYFKIDIKTKIYNDSVYYKMDLTYQPLMKEVPDEKNPNVMVKKDVSIVNYEDWKKDIKDYLSTYNLTLVFTDQDDFTVITKEIMLNKVSVNTTNGMTYEGSFQLDKSLATKINDVSFYYYLPEFKTK